MIMVKCVQKYRDKNNNIIGYRLQDIKRKQMDVKPDVLKKAIQNKEMMVLNLVLTSDGRLVDGSPTKYAENKENRNKSTGIEDTIPKKDYVVLTRDVLTHIGLTKDKDLQFMANKDLKRCRIDFGVHGYTVSKVGDFLVLTDAETVILASNTKIVVPYEGDKNYLMVLSNALNNKEYATAFDGISSRAGLFKGIELRELNLMDLSVMNDSIVGLFAGLKAKSVIVTGFDTSSIKKMSGLFYYSCIEELDLRGLDTRNVEDMCCLLLGAKIKNIIGLDKLNVSKVKNMAGMLARFSTNTALLDLSNWKVNNVTNVKNFSFGCTLHDIVMDGLEFSSLKVMSDMFYSASLDSLTFKNIKAPIAETSDNMFGMSTIGDLDILNLELPQAKEVSSTFYCLDCVRLRIENINIPSAGSIYSMFEHIQSPYSRIDMREIHMPKVYWLQRAFAGAFLNSVRVELTNNSELLEIGDMFRKARIMEDVDILGIIANIEDTSDMFKDCEIGTLRFIGKYYTPKWESANEMFKGAKIERAKLGALDFSTVKSMEDTFREAQIQEMSLVGCDFTNVENFNGTFKDSKIGRLYWGEFKASNIKTSIGMFSGCKAKLYTDTDGLRMKFNRDNGLLANDGKERVGKHTDIWGFTDEVEPFEPTISAKDILQYNSEDGSYTLLRDDFTINMGAGQVLRLKDGRVITVNKVR